MRSRRVSGPSGGGAVVSEIAATAALHGRELSEQGFTVDQVVHDYGDLCQAITDLAFERGVPIDIDEFRTLNRCLDNGIADAVTEYAFQRHSLVESNSVKAMNVRITAGMPPRAQLVSLADFVADVKISASLEAHARECEFTVNAVDAALALDVDREMLLAAVGNAAECFQVHAAPHRGLIQRLCCRGSHPDRRRGSLRRLPQGADEDLFLPFTQSGDDRSGLGLGLAICRRSIEANSGVLSVRDEARVKSEQSRLSLEQHVAPHRC